MNCWNDCQPPQPLSTSWWINRSTASRRGCSASSPALTSPPNSIRPAPGARQPRAVRCPLDERRNDGPVTTGTPTTGTPTTGTPTTGTPTGAAHRRGHLQEGDRVQLTDPKG